MAPAGGLNPSRMIYGSIKVARLMAVHESLPCRTAARLFNDSCFHPTEKEGSK